MAYDGKLLAKARGELERIREENRIKLQRRQDKIYAAIPEIRDIDRSMQGHMFKLTRLTLSGAPDIKERINEIERENLDLQARKAELLVSRGYPTNYLEPEYYCPVCQDRGMVGAGICSCVEKLYNKALTFELGSLIKHGDESFERFDLSLYSDSPDAKYGGVVPRQVMAKIFEACRSFADNFPDVSANLILQGEPGLGKTYLSACIARVVAAKGLSVCYETAVAALDAYEQQKFCRDSAEGEEAAAKVRRMSDCDLMILDDLGTEMPTPMAMSALYTLINTRLVKGKKTIISTNLSDEQLEKRYTPQICSRLAGEFLHLPFAGEDIRRIKKGV